ncbi:MAG: reverse transcriptase domain-containing protein, partial [Chromatiales bacterium]
SDIRVALDRKEGTLLVLLDLSSAFDAIDHTILLNRLRKRYGIQSYALQWIASYLQDRKQRVVIGQTTSEHHTCNTGVPQVSVLGPALFSLYVQPVGDVIRRHGVKFHHYADNLQLMHTFALNSTSLFEAIKRLQACIMEIREWLTSNDLKVNDQKTELLPIVPVSAKKLVNELSISVGGALIRAAAKA